MGISLADALAMQARLDRANKKPCAKRGEQWSGLEAELQDSIEELLQGFGQAAYWVRARMDLPTTTKKGTPDFVGCVRGIPFAMEVKRKGSKPTVEQLGELLRARLAGAKTATVYSLAEARDFLDSLQTPQK